MTIHMRPRTGDGELYTPGRDLAYCFPDMLQNVAGRFSEDKWPALMQLMEREKITFAQLQDGMDKLCLFMVRTQERPDVPIQDLMRDVGWLDVPPQVQIGINAMLGTVVIGQMFAAIRDLALIDAPHQISMYPLIKYGKISKLLMYMPPWRRRLYFFVRDSARWWRRKTKRRNTV